MQGIDGRQLMIIFQNALGHATQISMHNAKHTNSEVDPDEIIKLAKKIATQVVKVGVIKGED